MGKDFDKSLEDLATGPAASDAAEEMPVGPEADAASHPTVVALRARFGAAVLRHEVQAGDEHVVFIAPERSLEILGWLRDEPSQAYSLLLDVTGVDYGGGRPLQIVYQLWSLEHRRQLRVKAELPVDALEIDSVWPLWRTADWLERETYDMFGVQFRGHPDLRRILMPDTYAEGFPLRKDFPLRGRFSRAEQTRHALSMDVEDFYIPDELAFDAEEAAAKRGAAGERPGGDDA